MADYPHAGKSAQRRIANRSAVAGGARSYRSVYVALLLVLAAIAILVAIAPLTADRAPPDRLLPRMIKPSAGIPRLDAADPSYMADPAPDSRSGDNMIVAPDPSRRLLSISYRL